MMRRPRYEILVIDYGMGNVGSIVNMLRKINCPVAVSSQPDDVRNAHKLILPGVGSFDHGMENLEERKLIAVLEEKVVRQGAPLLGICLGMQLLTGQSEEGERPGFGWINAKTIKFRFDAGSALKAPHMGWNEVYASSQSTLFPEISEERRFYFAHSYFVVCESEENVIAKTHHGWEFASAIKKDNVYGVQFHPEKSHKYGLKLLKNFVERA